MDSIVGRKTHSIDGRGLRGRVRKVVLATCAYPKVDPSVGNSGKEFALASPACLARKGAARQPDPARREPMVDFGRQE